MGIVRSWIFRFIYPIPKKKDDLLMHKQKFIEEYISSHQAVTDLKEQFIPKSIRESFFYIKNKNDKEQKKRQEAYKTWRKIALKKRGGRG